MAWEKLVTYARAIRFERPGIAKMLDILEELQPPDGNISDRFSAMTDFIERGVASGLITPSEEWLIREALAPNM